MLDKKKNFKINGFTMVELIAIVTIIAVIALVSAPAIINMTRNSEIKRNEENLKNIYMAAENYIMANYNKCQQLDDDNGVCYIKINTLINEDYIDGKMKNPVTNLPFANDDIVKVTRTEDNMYNFDLIKENDMSE